MPEKYSKQNLDREMMASQDDEKEPHCIAPQNSVSNIRSKLGLWDEQNYTSFPAMENSFKKQIVSGGSSCPHCENMAKNFLYLESLIRTNYKNKQKCNVCFSSLKYLQYVNKSILDVFGDFDVIVEAAKAFNSTSQSKNNSMALKKSKKSKLKIANNKIGSKNVTSVHLKTTNTKISKRQSPTHVKKSIMNVKVQQSLPKTKLKAKLTIKSKPKSKPKPKQSKPQINLNVHSKKKIVAKTGKKINN